MKLAEALDLRSEASKRLDRLHRSAQASAARYQEAGDVVAQGGHGGRSIEPGQ